MADKLEFTPQERESTLQMYAKLKEKVGSSLLPGDEDKMRERLVASRVWPMVLFQ